MSPEGIPTPRTDQLWKELCEGMRDKKDVTATQVALGMCKLSDQLETELHCANQKLQAIRELVEKSEGLNYDMIPLSYFTKILNS